MNYDLIGAQTFFNEHKNNVLRSTGSNVVTVTTPLYNVDGSQCDPRLGKSWKQLLIDNSINEPCYVTNNDNPGQSHPNVWLGGHMTKDRTGIVPNGGSCYLMPLCSWHNSTARNRVAFTHTKNKMLLLTGYMNCDTALTFSLRQEGTDAPFRIGTYEDGKFNVEDLDQNDLKSREDKILALGTQAEPPHIILKKVSGGFRFISATGLNKSTNL